MTIPDVTREQLIAAMERFDQELRQTSDWVNWEQKENHKYAIEHEGLRYPVKQIIALATNSSTNTFSGGDEANRYINKHGFHIARLDHTAHVDPSAEVTFDHEALASLIRGFTARYGSFTSQAYLDDERKYKLEAANRLQELLSESRLSGLIERGEFEVAHADIRRAYSGNNLLNQWDVLPIVNAPAETLVHRLYYLLYSSSPFEQRFTHWIELLRQEKPTCWPAATYYLMLHEPWQHIFVKADPYRLLLKAIKCNISWEPHPSAATYRQFQRLGILLLEALSPLGAQDLIDVQSFIWIVRDEQAIEAVEFVHVDLSPPDLTGMELTGAQAGLSMDQQIRIALQTMIEHGGVAQTAQIYHAIESQMNGAQLSQQGRASLRTFINREAVQDGFVAAYDRNNPGWHITPAGRDYAKGIATAIDPQIAELSVPYHTIAPRSKTMPRIPAPHAERIYQAAERFVNAALRTDDSLFTPGRHIWSLPNIDDLYNRFVDQPDTSDDDFMTKFWRQLQGAPADTIQLAAELLYVHFLPASNRTISGSNKRDKVQAVLNWSPEIFPLPADLALALDVGIATMGTAFGTFRHELVSFLLNFIRSWKHLSDEEHTRLLNDSWAFKQMLFDVPMYAAYSQREILLHLIHPATFEPIASRDHKQKIDRAFARYVTEPTNDIDRRLLQIRERLSTQYGENFHFYWPEIYNIWHKGEAAQIEPESSVEHVQVEQLERSAPLSGALGSKLRPYVQLAIRLDDDSYTPEAIVELLGLIHPPIADLRAAPDTDDLVADLMLLRLIEPLENNRYRRWQHLADATETHMLRYAALTLLLPVEGEDDMYQLPILYIPRDGRSHPAGVWPGGESLLTWYEEAGLVQQMADGWQLRSDALQPLPESTPTAYAINTFLDHLTRVWIRQYATPTLDTEHLPVLDEATLDTRIAEIQGELLIDRSTILRIYRSLIAGRHVILSGPPGTGKTHLARILPRILWRDESTIRLSLPTRPERSPTDEPVPERIIQHGYAVEVVTATEDWGIRHVIGGIVPQLHTHDSGRTLVYGVRHGCLTRTILQNYGVDGETLPEPSALTRQALEHQQQRYRGRWLVIDEFTRAPIDAAFGSLLTTLGGQSNPKLSIPTNAGIDREITLPRDFRLIGTLNSFDRHFLNQISEAMKRRFTFIDVLPPGRELAVTEQAMAMYRALMNLRTNGLPAISVDEVAGRATWDQVLEVHREDAPDNLLARVHYVRTIVDEDAQPVLDSFWRLFEAIRIYRQLGTAQAEAVYATVFAGRSIGMSWTEALDSALADVLADQLQVLARDEQRVLLVLIEHAANPARFVERVKEILKGMPVPRQVAHLGQLKAAGAETIDNVHTDKLEVGQLSTIFNLGEPLSIPAAGLFARRLYAFINERGL